MIASIILAAGKGTRIKSTDRNKVTLPFLNKPLIVYAVELMHGISDKTVVVVGAFHESVREALGGHDVIFAHQTDQLGTGHALQVGIEELQKQGIHPTEVLVCYGDHSMFYKKETVERLIGDFHKEHAAMAMLSTRYNDPNSLAWGRIKRDAEGNVHSIIEQKDATDEERKITEINPGFYLFDFSFLTTSLQKIKPSSVTGEYYMTDLLYIAKESGKKVIALEVPFHEVGIGINKQEEMEESERLYLKRDLV